MVGSVYNEEHTGSLLRFAARINEAKEFWLAYEFGLPFKETLARTIKGRWFGNISESFTQILLRQFESRFWCHHPVAMALQDYFRNNLDHEEFKWFNHLSLLLYDRYYRFAAAGYLPERMAMGLLEISNSTYYRLHQAQMPEDISVATATKGGRNCLLALMENGLLKGSGKKTIVSPALSAKNLALLLYVLNDLGESANAFDGSPLFQSLLKPREQLLPIMNDGERLGYWQFNGDHNRLSLHLNHPNLRTWAQKVAQ